MRSSLRARPRWEEKEEKEEGEGREEKKKEERRGEERLERYIVYVEYREVRAHVREESPPSLRELCAWALCQGAVPEKKKRVLGRERQGLSSPSAAAFEGFAGTIRHWFLPNLGCTG